MTIELYSWATPNGHKVHIMLEELGVPYNVHAINIGAGDQFDPDFLKISPNNKMPAIVDPDGPGGEALSLFESGAILIYLAEKHGRFLSQEPRRRYTTLQWLMWQMGGLGPMLGQAHHFRRYARDDHAYANDRYTNEAGRLYHVLDRRLGEADWLAGDAYTIADMAVYPWLRPYKWQGQDLAAFDNVQRWYSAVRARPAVQRGLAVLKDRVDLGKGSRPEGESWDILFGDAQARMGGGAGGGG